MADEGGSREAIRLILVLGFIPNAAAENIGNRWLWHLFAAAATARRASITRLAASFRPSTRWMLVSIGSSCRQQILLLQLLAFDDWFNAKFITTLRSNRHTHGTCPPIKLLILYGSILRCHSRVIYSVSAVFSRPFGLLHFHSTVIRMIASGHSTQLFIACASSTWRLSAVTAAAKAIGERLHVCPLVCHNTNGSASLRRGWRRQRRRKACR